MTQRVRNRFLVILGVLVLSAALILGVPPSLSNVGERIKLGLDLKGGIHLVMQVMVEDAVRGQTDAAIDSVRQGLTEANVIFRLAQRRSDSTFEVVGVDTNKDADFRRVVSERLPDWDISSIASDTPNAYSVRMRTQVEQLYREQAVEQAINTIRNRVDQLGVAEATLQKHGGPGENEILVQLPGIDDPNRVKGLMINTAQLELKLVEAGPFSSRDTAIQNFGGTVPANVEILPSVNAATGEAFYAVQSIAAVSGADLKTAYPSRDENGRPAVTFGLNANGADRFGRVTEQNIGKQLAIVLDDRVQSAPTIQARITDSGIITGGPGGFQPKEAQDLALVLRSGALPASIRYLQEQVVGPSLGADSIRQGLLASVVALLAVLAFVLFYYRLSGLNAMLAMVLNLILLFAAMAYFGAVLTLPGIAGVILTIGVGIDSNVLIFERIREELRSGRTAVASVTTSFKRVFITLVDTHLAALISAMFLFLFGTGPVKGFAVTLVIGLVSNMFTSVFVSRTLFEWTLGRQRNVETLSI